jgi:hypothetical protein
LSFIDQYSIGEHGAHAPNTKATSMTMQNELNTITSTMNDLSVRITALVETEGSAMAPDIYTELVAAERTIGALLRRLNRVAGRIN